MAVRAPYEIEQQHPVPEGVFPPEAVALSVANPVHTAPGGGQAYYFARWIDLPEGTYTMTAFADDSATWWVGDDQMSQRIIGSHTLPQHDVTFEFYYPGGVQRMGIVLHNLPPEPTPCYVIYVLKRDGEIIESAHAAPWVFDTNPIIDDDVPSMPESDPIIWTLMPNWKDGISERLEWVTDVMESESGAEQRRSIRLRARRSLEVSFLRKGADRSRIDSLFVSLGHREFLIPLWQEHVKMVEGITIGAAGVELVDGTTEEREFRPGDVVLVNNGDPDHYDLLAVGAVESTRFDWAEPPTNEWPPGTRVYPCRLARLIDPPQFGQLSDQVGMVRARFDLVEPDNRPANFGNGLGFSPTFYFPPERSSVMDFTYMRKAYSLDNESSITQYRDVGGQSRVNMKLSVRLFGRGSVGALRRFISAARGRAVSFMMPTYMHDVPLAEDIQQGAVYVDALPQGFSRHMDGPQPVRLMLRFETSSGETYRVIQSVEPVFDDNDNLVAERFHLDEGMPAMAVRDVLRVSYVAPARFDQDAFELVHHVANLRAVSCTLVVRQLYSRRGSI